MHRRRFPISFFLLRCSKYLFLMGFHKQQHTQRVWKQIAASRCRCQFQLAEQSLTSSTACGDGEIAAGELGQKRKEGAVQLPPTQRVDVCGLLRQGCEAAEFVLRAGGVAAGLRF